MLSFKEMRGGDTLKKFALDDLKRMQEMSLDDKIKRTELLIKEWYEHYNGNVIISFSGVKIVQYCYISPANFTPTYKQFSLIQGLNIPK